MQKFTIPLVDVPEFAVLDIETRSLCNLRDAGTHRYAADDTTDLLSVAWGRRRGGEFKKRAWSPFRSGSDNDAAFSELQEVLELAARGQIRLIGHNSLGFDHVVLEALAARYKLPQTPIQAWTDDTMLRARFLGLPPGLDKLTEVLGLDRKLAEGSDLIKVFNAQRKGQFVVGDPAVDPRLDAMLAYNLQDIEVTYQVHQRLPYLPDQERRVVYATALMNNGGVGCDLDLSRALSQLEIVALERATTELTDITDGAVRSPRQSVAFRKWLNGQGVQVDGVSREKLQDAIPQIDPTAPAASAIRAALEVSGSALSKARAILERVSPDGRLRGEFHYWGAQSGRYVAKGVQLQNIVRPTLAEQDRETAIELILSGNADLIPAILDVSSFEAGKSVLRPIVIAPEGQEIHVGDYSRIEFVLLMHAVGAKEKLKIGDPYRLLAVQLFEEYTAGRPAVQRALRILREGGVPDGADMEELQAAMGRVSKANRQIAKPFVLGSGYGGGPVVMQTQCKSQGLLLSFDECQMASAAYGHIFPEVALYRSKLLDYAISCAMGNGPIEVGQCARFEVVEGDLQLQIPGGFINYPAAKVSTGRDRWNRTASTVDYWVAKNSGWFEASLIQTELTAHNISGLARNLMCHAIVNAVERGLAPILTVHDELVVEGPPGSADELRSAMLDLPSYLQPLEGIIAVEVGSHRRYLK